MVFKSKMSASRVKTACMLRIYLNQKYEKSMTGSNYSAFSLKRRFLRATDQAEKNKGSELTR